MIAETSWSEYSKTNFTSNKPKSGFHLKLFYFATVIEIRGQT